MSSEIPTDHIYLSPPNSTMAIVSLVAGILGLTILPLIGGIVALYTGYSARREIEDSYGELFIITIWTLISSTDLVQLGANTQLIRNHTAQLLKLLRHDFQTTESLTPRNTSAWLISFLLKGATHFVSSSLRTRIAGKCVAPTKI
jgi:hypothetical protein